MSILGEVQFELCSREWSFWECDQSPTLDKETDHKCIGATYEKNILNQRLNLEGFDYCSCMPKIATVEP